MAPPLERQGRPRRGLRAAIATLALSAGTGTAWASPQRHEPGEVDGVLQHAWQRAGREAPLGEVLDFQRAATVGLGERAASWDEAAPGLLLSGLAGAATSLGALALPFLPPGGPPPSTMAFAMSLAAGVMVAVSWEMLWPHLRPGGGDPWRPLLLFGASALLCLALCRLGDLAERHSGAAGHKAAEPGGAGPQAALPGEPREREPEPEPHAGQQQREQRRSARLAVLLFASLTAHNVPEGFAVAVSALSGHRLGITVCIAVALHNIPEGVTLAVATYDATKSRLQAAVVPACAGLAEPLGAVAALFLFRAHVTEQLVDDLLAAVAGVMSCIALAELLPEAAATRCWRSAALGFALGWAVMLLTHVLIEHTAGEANISLVH